MAFRGSKILLIVLQILAFWSVWRWFYLRLSTSSDEFYGIATLIAVIALSLRFRCAITAISNFDLIVASIVVYVAAFPFAPPLLRAAIAITSLTFSISGWRFGRKFHFGIWSLFLLSLPIVASMQFYLGFPMRVIVGEATVFLLRLNDLAIFREGVCLYFGERLIWIDAPCSGIKMLWAGFFLTALLITVYEFRLLKSFAAFALGFVIIMLGNIFRATGLFYLEAEIIKLPASAHPAIGVSAFILTCAAIGIVVSKLKNIHVFELKPTSAELENKADFSLWQTMIFGLICLSALSVSFINVKNPTIRFNQQAVDFPDKFEDKPLKELILSERERFFLQDFPGEIRRFTDGRRETIIRRVTKATRKLHPASDCFSAIGYQIKPLPLKIDEAQNKWSCFAASRNDENLNVCERIFTENGESWTDVSSWYWSAINDNDKDYWAITTAELND